jgi:hypothetical protein
VQELIAAEARHNIVIEVGGVPVRVHTTDRDFVKLLENRYAGFVSRPERAEFDFEIHLAALGSDPEADVSVKREARGWSFQRGDFRAEWDPAARRGRIQQTPNPYSMDSVLRIVHTLVLAGQGGFLVHAASAVRNGKAFLFAGVSGAGKTTISRLAPPDAAVLTDEISYVRREGEGYRAYGTPFAGELARVGENVSAPLAALYLLAQGPKNKIEAVDKAEAARALLTNILFFAEDPQAVIPVFESACDFVSRVPVKRLTFVADARVWEMIG